VNTGVMHLAAATGATTVALNGPTSEARWGPIGERAVSVNSDLPGCGYLNLGFEYDRGRPDCMRAISVDRVTEAVLALTGDD
jgi:ADP-heptose:LPS heptosyltransferase